ncbi:hypothetical protein MFLAVUS_007644 [Mucor flavus]|uniref:Uncharacterized protein n=1 Tax=Mucor flavus TaxID=439312 RepID=A0ABP9Z4V2_9FUNG
MNHTTTDCPQRSMAWITINEYDQILSVTKEMIQLLDYDPTNQYLDSIWKPIESDQSYLIVSTLQSLRTLCICTHTKDNMRILICTDITDLNHMYSKRNHSVTITRLTMYGTIEAAFQSQVLPTLSVGHPMMRYIHSDDVQKFCAGLNEASKDSCINTFSVRMVHDDNKDDDTYQYSEFTVMAIDGGRKILCLIKPSSLNPDAIVQQQHYNNVLRETVTQIQSKFWYAIENGMTAIAHSLAASLVLFIQTLWQLWYDQDKTWSGLFSTSSEYLLRTIVKTTKERPEVEKMCRFMSWAGGISPSTSRSFIDTTLDQTSEWLIAKTHIHSAGCDTVV